MKKAKSYGYEHVGFILDRGYFCKENVQFMDKNGYQFVIMAKGMKKLVSELVLEVQGTFENDRKNSIRAYKVSGTTVKRKLFAADKKERYFHIFYDDGKKASERERFENRIDRMGRKLKECMGEPIHLYDISTPIIARLNFIEGSGQLCSECYRKLYFKENAYCEH